MQTLCLEEYDVKALLFSQVAWSLFLEKMDPDFGRTLVPECRVILAWYLQKWEQISFLVS